MSSETAKRARKLAKQLFEIQAGDFELTAPSCIAIKHSLKGSKYCRTVEILAGPDTEPTIWTRHNDVPNFILSQLEAQKLTSQDTSRNVSLSPLAYFVLCCIPPYLSKDDTIPTLFYWQNPKTHRTSCLFAYVDRYATMPSCTYTTGELLRLRGHGIQVSLPEAPKKGHDQANHSANRPISNESRTLGRHHRNRPYLSLQAASLRIKDGNAIAPESMNLPSPHSRRGSTSTGPVDTEWKYRGRTDSEAVASSEPLSAPTGLGAQHSEGFQRFYKAVASPTHIRVTAGGRIVPNTRGTSPISKQFKDKVEDSNQVPATLPIPPQARQSEDSLQPATKAAQLPMFAFPPPHFYPAFSASLPQVPMMPLPVGLSLPGGFSFPGQLPFPPNAMPPPQQNMAKASDKENHQMGSNDEAPGPKTSTEDGTTEKKVPAPDQVDHTKPYIINGQVMYPFPGPAYTSHVAPGSQHQYLPAGFIGHPGYPVAPFPNGLISHPSVGMSHMLSTPIGFPGVAGPIQFPPAGTNPNGTQGLPLPTSRQPSSNLPPPTALPISSIRPSEISRKQIEMLRNSLKYHKDQLQYNKHQIDEREMEKTVNMLQSQIDRFETLNKSQLLFEETHYPKKDNRSSEASSLPSHGSGGRSHTDTISQVGSRRDPSNSKRAGSLRRTPPILAAKKNEFHFEPVEPPVQFTDPVKKSTLPSRAALAPPFQPRVAMANGKSTTQGIRSLGDNETTLGGSESTRFQWDRPAVGNDSGNTVVHRRSSHSKSRRQESSSRKHLELDKPYLIGILPVDVNPQNARGTDYVYERELTEDEIRSRCLYWGKAPSFTNKGLPKFDGKDFYPPSPSKDVERNDSLSRLPRCCIPTGDPEVDYGAGAPSKTSASGHSSMHGAMLPRKSAKVTLRRPEPYSKGNLLQKDAQQATVAETGASAGIRGDRGQVGNSAMKVLPNMLKRTISGGSDALPGSVTSVTAQGILPQYSSGYESMDTPSLSSIIASPQIVGRPSPTKSDDRNVFLAPISRKIRENRPPPDDVGPVSLEQQFRSIVSLENKQSAALPVHWGAV